MKTSSSPLFDVSHVLQPGVGCLGAPGVAVLSLTGRRQGCVTPEQPTGSPPAPLEAAAAVDAALNHMGASAPRLVVIGADLDPLRAPPGWADAALAAAGRLVARGVAVRLATRGAPRPSEGWGRLLAEAARGPGATLEIALSTLDAQVSALYEPDAPPPAQRLQAARALHDQGVAIEARIHPLLPWISDTAAHLEPLAQALARAGVRRLSASYLHLDHKGSRRLRSLPPAHRALLRGCLGGVPGPGGGARLLPASLRAQGHARLRRIAAAAGIQAIACAEANPDLHDAGACVIAPSRSGARAAAPRKATVAAEAAWPRVLHLPFRGRALPSGGRDGSQAAGGDSSAYGGGVRQPGARQLALFADLRAG